MTANLPDFTGCGVGPNSYMPNPAMSIASAVRKPNNSLPCPCQKLRHVAARFEHLLADLPAVPDRLHWSF